MEYAMGKFYVNKRHDGQYEILKRDLWITTEAVLFPLWDIVRFDSFVKAVKYLKENFENLI